MKRHFTLAMLVLAGVVLAASPTDGKSRGNALAEQVAAGWNSHNADEVAGAFAADGVYEDVAYGAVNHGRGEIRKFAADIFAAVPDLKFEAVRISVQGSHGTMEWVWSGTDQGLFKTGKHFSVRGVSVFEIRGGQIVSNKDYYDLATIMRQVGALPAGF